MEVQAINSLNPLALKRTIQCTNCNYLIKLDNTQLYPVEGYCPNCGKHLKFKESIAFPNQYTLEGDLVEINDAYIQLRAKQIAESDKIESDLNKVQEEVDQKQGILKSVYSQAFKKLKAYISFYKSKNQGDLNV